ncbi:MAG: hypothetical protein TQ37_05205 [Candidatus Synechococcus spongiarum 15L]|uniref:Uncharacterized protein n=1 Tax=Candidatus Synechococcus spongiarum 15L TaxID=1608419 RepID=A0A0G8AVU7_9SYNE|nr:MAG: hypothetical protein TQ37_05205 [Candidatus Synechococcus spongiarum 15L]
MFSLTLLLCTFFLCIFYTLNDIFEFLILIHVFFLVSCRKVLVLGGSLEFLQGCQCQVLIPAR